MLAGPATLELVRVQAAQLAGVVAVLQTLALIVFAPLVGASTIAGDRQRGTWLLLLSSPVRRSAIAMGKVVAAWCQVLLLLCVSLPFSIACVVLGGLDFGPLLGLYLSHMLTAAALASVGVATSAWFRRTWSAALAAVAVALALSVVPFFVYAAVGGESSMMDPGPRTVVIPSPTYGAMVFLGGDGMPGARRDMLLHGLAMGVLVLGANAVLMGRLRSARW